MKMTLKLFFTLLTWLCLAPAGFAATTTVLVGNGGLVFTPAVANINVGDQVVWNWSGNFHSTTSGTGGTPNGLWDSGVANAPHSFTNTFNSAGNFSYYCSIHVASGMTGAVVVASASLPPTVTITSPTNGAVFSEPANVTIDATASGSGGTVTNVQILVGADVLSNQTTEPFTATTNNLPAGSYTLSAVAADDGGLKATNSITISVVTPVPITIGSPQWLPPSNFQFNYSANVGLRYVVQRTTSLTSPDWTDIVTNMAGSNPVSFTDSNAAAGNGFYRVGRLPNP